MATHKITFDVAKTTGSSLLDPVILRRGETGLTKIVAELYENDVPMVTTGYAARFMALNASGDYVISPATLSSNEVSYTVDNGLTAAYGDVRVAYFELSKSGSIITTGTIPIIVLRNVDLTAEQAEEYRNQIDQLVEELEGYKAKLDAATNEAKQAASKADTATQNANSATQEAKTATQAAKDATTATQAATQAAKDATTATQAATKEAQAATEAANQSKANADAAAKSATDAASKATSSAGNADAAAQKATDAAASANEAADRVDASIASSQEATKAAQDATQQAKTSASNADTAAQRANDAADTVDQAMETYVTETGSTVEWQLGDSGTTPPAGAWASSVPQPVQGKFLWSRTTTTHNRGPDTITYQCAYQGIDGVTSDINGLFWLYVDENGDLWAVYNDADNPPQFELTEDKLLYAVFDY